MTRRTPAARRPAWENRAGWWGILRWCTAVTTAVLALASLTAGLTGGRAAAASAVLGGGIVLALSALTGWTTAVVWERARDAALPVSMGAFVVKIVVIGLLLAVVPRPDWLEALPATLGAVAAVAAWQATEVGVFARTRRSIYAD